MKLKPKTIQAIQATVSNYFLNVQGKPYHITEGQCEIWYAVTNQNWSWVWASAPTRYGKTEIVAMAILYLASFYHLKIPIVAGSEDKANKIMEYIVQHISDHEILYEGLIIESLKNVEKLKVTMSKSALRWSTGGWIFVTSIDSRSIKREGEGVVGEGGDIIVLEEAGLITRKDQFSKVVRMPEKNKGWGKLIMIGNCIEGSVFQSAYTDSLYHKVKITLDQAINEGRYTQQELDEKKLQTTLKDWKRYYLVEFPQAGEFTYFKPKKYDKLPPMEQLDIYGTLDPALGKPGGSLNAIVIGAKHRETGQGYEIDSFGLEKSPEDTMQFIFRLPYTFKRFGIEAVQFQRYFLSELKKKSMQEGRYINFVGIEQKRKKEERIESIEPVVATSQVLFRGDNILWDHMQNYPDIDKLDMLDACEMVLRLMGIVGYDPKRDASRIVV